ncbi:MAG: hypothetical protein ACR2HR_04340 [Euzebya sp.]
MHLFPLPPARLVVVLKGVAILGLLAAVVGAISGWILLGRTSAALEASLDLTSDTLEALDASAGVASDTIGVLGTSLATLESTTADLDAAFDDGETLMGELATLVRDDVATSVGAIDDSLPGLITVAGTIDATLRALSSLPFGPTYDPNQSFAESLVTLQTSLDGLPERLTEQADLIDQTAGSLGEVGQGVSDLTIELAGFDATLSQTSELLATYDDTITQGRDLVAQASADLSGQLLVTRLAIVLFALAFAGLQVVPLHLAAVASTELLEQEATRSAPRATDSVDLP